MKRRWNMTIWIGFLVVLSASFSYLPVFARFPITRDFPWVNLLMFGAGLALIVYGVAQAHREPQSYRGKIAGTILLSLGVALFAFFTLGIFYFARQLPASNRAPRIGQKAPDFTLPDQDSKVITLSNLLESGTSGPGGASAVLLIFYRGYW